jgi:hypothetical protein
MRLSSLLTVAAFAVSLAASTGALAANFSGIPDMPPQQAQDPSDLPGLQPGQTGPYDSPAFLVPQYEINS